MPDPQTQNPGVHRRRVGDATVSALLDGFIELSYNVWNQAVAAEMDASQKARGLTLGAFRNGITSFLVESGGKRIMVDVGAAGQFGPYSKAFPGNLSLAGLKPEDIDEVLATHLHTDHIGALVIDGKPTLPKAILRTTQAEIDFWRSDEHLSRAPGWMRPWFEVTRAILDVYKGRVETFTPGKPIGNGFTSFAFPGHTPGHVAYLFESRNDRIMFLGDLMVSPSVQGPNPKAHMIFDIDPDEGYRSRVRGLDQAAADHVLSAATHWPFPTFAYITRRGNGYDWIPAEWQYDASGRPIQPIM